MSILDLNSVLPVLLSKSLPRLLEQTVTSLVFLKSSCFWSLTRTHPAGSRILDYVRPLQTVFLRFLEKRRGHSTHSTHRLVIDTNSAAGCVCRREISMSYCASFTWCHRGAKNEVKPYFLTPSLLWRVTGESTYTSLTSISTSTSTSGISSFDIYMLQCHFVLPRNRATPIFFSQHSILPAAGHS